MLKNYMVSAFWLVSLTVIVSGLLFFSTSEFFLIAGSDAIDYVNDYPLWCKLISIFLMGFAFFLIYFKKSSNTLRVFLFTFTLFIYVLNSQAVVFSGKKQALIHTILGFKVATINFDPTKTDLGLQFQQGFGISQFSNDKEDIVIISGICPFCMNIRSIL